MFKTIVWFKMTTTKTRNSRERCICKINVMAGIPFRLVDNKCKIHGELK